MQRRKKLIFWRIEQRLRQRDIANKLGITLVHYSNLERGISNPSYELLIKFKEVYNIRDIIDLFEKEDYNYDNGDTSGDIDQEQVLDR